MVSKKDWVPASSLLMTNISKSRRSEAMASALSRRCQQLSRHLLVLFGTLGHAVIGSRFLITFGFGRFFHDEGVAVEPGELVGQGNEVIVSCPDPDPVQIGHVSHHAIDDGRCAVDALGRKLLHVLIDLRGQPTKFTHAHGVLIHAVASVKCPIGADAGRTLISMS